MKGDKEMISNILTALSYYWVGIILLYFAHKSKLVRKIYMKNLKEGNSRLLITFTFTFVVFTMFVFSCGNVHFAMAFELYDKWIHKFFIFVCCCCAIMTAIASSLVFPLVVVITDKLELTDEGKLKLIQNRLIDVVESCQESIVILSAECYIISANKASCNFFGSSYINKSIDSFIHLDDKRKFRQAVARLYALSIQDSDQNNDGGDEDMRRVHIEYRVGRPHSDEWLWIESTLTLRKSDELDITDEPLLFLRCPSMRVDVDSMTDGDFDSPFVSESYNLMMISRNMTSRKREEQLRLDEERTRAKEQENQAKLQYITSCAHDLKTPLQSFVFAIELLSQTNLQPDQKDIVEQARTSSALMALTISQTIDNSRALMGVNLVPRKGTIELSGVVARVAVIIESYSREVDITFHLPSNVRNRIISDEEWLWQMILNYLTNACKFTESGSIDLYIQLWSDLPADHALKKKQMQDLESASGTTTTMLGSSSSSPGSNGGTEMLVFEVMDTGVGVSESNALSLFQVFSQAQLGQLTGTGMGLYGVKIRSEGLRGQCGMYNRRDAAGSVFWFKIPYVVDDSEFDGESLGDISLYAALRRFPVKESSDSKGLQQLIIEVPVVKEMPEPRLRTDSVSTAPGSVTSRNEDGSIPVSGFTAYVVDDSVTIRKLMHKILHSLQFARVELFENGSKGLEAMKQEAVDVVFMDIQMPVMTGPEAVARFRKFESERGCEKRQLIVAVSANFSIEDGHNLVNESMFDAVVAKPMHASEIKQIMASYSSGSLPLTVSHC